MYIRYDTSGYLRGNIHHSTNCNKDMDKKCIQLNLDIQLSFESAPGHYSSIIEASFKSTLRLD